MYNNLLLSLATSIIPPLTLVFVAVLVLFKSYKRVRAKFNATVNCWFCNQNTKVPYLESNSWMCPKCEQYNGFDKDGGYNREIFQQHDCSANSNSSFERGLDYPFAHAPQNGFCNVCNEAQRLKVEKLAQFEPKHEFRYDEELKVFKSQLEKEFRLCTTCDRHLNKVLREKKKMVLGSKFFQFFNEGAVALKQPYFNQIQQQQQWKGRLTLFIGIFAAVNIFCLFGKLPLISREALNSFFGDSFGELLFKCQSHFWALAQVAAAYLKRVSEHETFIKLALFSQTFFVMILYSLGLKVPQITRLNFSSLFMVVSPFAILVLALGRNVLDRFRLSRFTVLLVLWSVLTGGLINEQLLAAQHFLTLFASLATFFVVITSETEPLHMQHDATVTSFHKICAEDYYSDDDTASLLSQQLSCSQASSMYNTSLNRSIYEKYPLSQSRLQHDSRQFSPTARTSSLISLNNRLSSQTRTQLTPNSTFKPLNDVVASPNEAQLRAPYVDRLYNFGIARNPPSTTQSLIGNNLDMSYRERPLPTGFGLGLKASYNPANISFGSTQSVPQFGTPLPSLHNDTRFLSSAAVQPMYTATPLLSHFSVSSNAIYQQQRPPSLLSPSRFSANCLENHTSVSPWLSGSYLNQQQQQRQEQSPLEQQLTQNGNLYQNISRTSSQSSGFESQAGRQIGCNENYLTTEINDLPHNAESTCTAPISSRHLSILNLARPLNINCASMVSGMRSPLSPVSRTNNMDIQDPFNLRKINDELPKYKRGTLLKKLQRGQAIS